MILGLSTSAFTALHVIISLLAIISGLITRLALSVCLIGSLIQRRLTTIQQGVTFVHIRSTDPSISRDMPMWKHLIALAFLAGIRRAAALLPIAAFLVTAAAYAEVKPWPSSFHGQQIPVSDGTQYVRVGGTGPAVVLLHGFGDTGDMWVPLAESLMKDHTVVVPDLRGMGLSSHPEGGYRKVEQARDLAAILDQLGLKNVALVTHDIGNMVGYAFAAQYPSRTTMWVVMDAPLPGIGHWDEQLKNPKVWHFNFRGPDVERLVAGRERILLDRFYNELSANPAAIDEQTRDHYAALYARPQAIHNSFSGQFASFADDALDNQKLLAEKGKLTMPVFAIGGDHSYGTSLATDIGFAATNVRAAVVKNSGHWIMEEQPAQAVELITSFIRKRP